jgi:predicted TPR repeat methyltransferase
MKKSDVITIHDEEASQYDQQVREYEYYVHDLLFGMCFEYISAQERLLDIGIGTGLASLPFAKAGLEIYGFDGSSKMLKICESKSFARELKKFDLRKIPFPYPDSYFDHAICSGVFHFFGELVSMIKEVSRIVKPEGIFAFTIAGQNFENEKTKNETPQDYLKIPTSWGEKIFAHGNTYIINILQDCGFIKQKMQKILIRGGDNECDDLLFKIYVAQKTQK